MFLAARIALSVFALHLLALFSPSGAQEKTTDWAQPKVMDGRCTIPIIEASDFSTRNFDGNLLSQGPVLIRGLTAAQAAHERWDRPNFQAEFGNAYGMTTVPLYSTQFSQAMNSPENKHAVALKSYLSDMAASNNGKKLSPLQMFERAQNGLAAQALSLHGIPDVLLNMSQTQQGDAVLSLGVHREGMPLHQHSSTWLSLLRGRKLWFFMAPDSLQNHIAYEILALKLPKRWPNRFLYGQEAHNINVCDQLPGDVVHVPALWYHATLNDGDVLGVGMQSSELDEASLNRHSRSAFVKDLRARNTIIEVEAKNTTKWRKKISNALTSIDNAIAFEPLDFGRRSNAVLARARVAKMEGKNSTEVVLELFKEWSKVERVANATYTRGVLSPSQFAAVMASLIQSIRKAVPQELLGVGRDVLEYLRRTGLEVDRLTFDSFGLP